MDHVSHVHEQWRTERPDLDTSPVLVIGRIHRIAAALTPELTAVYARYGLGEGEFDVLATLRRQGAPYVLTPGELSERTMVTTGAVSKRLDRLEARGLVERRAAEGDGRSRTVHLSAAGRTLIDEAMTTHIANEQRLLAALPEADRAALAELLGRLAASLGA
ncbi:MarR family winged helix-turn-helix transcriptional regulator [Phycicoccus flavus]|uniref:MarR family winged helix-turn-helix transcriptional regulator n=1 Tax=Phycicoccus flavus TaxID=2502783 RepID=UPI000FEB60CC|nr:MarR family transcriptional regulator [Phycicoccus flavus]NHA66733.1 MarR family transcriptional regulator [Phycicoccus flavus]